MNLVQGAPLSLPSLLICVKEKKKGKISPGFLCLKGGEGLVEKEVLGC